MESNRKEFDKDIFFDYIKNYKLRTSDVSYLMRLYRIYILVDELKKIDSERGEAVLSKCEDVIYTINGKKIPEIKRIELEVSKISKKLNDNKQNTKINNDISEIKKILKNISLDDKNIVEYVKKKISVMQAMLGINNTFLEESYKVFLEEYRSIIISINMYNEEKKKNLNVDFKLKLKNFDDDFEEKIKGR